MRETDSFWNKILGALYGRWIFPNLDLYCEKNSSIGVNLGNCALGTRVVMNLLKLFFEKTAAGRVPKFHLYFDNYFTNLDLMVHLHKLRLKCTGTIRENRVTEKNIISKKSPRGSYVVKHDKNSGMNYITAMDSKLVSIVSTAAGVTPMLNSRRCCAAQCNNVIFLGIVRLRS